MGYTSYTILIVMIYIYFFLLKINFVIHLLCRKGVTSVTDVTDFLESA